MKKFMVLYKSPQSAESTMADASPEAAEEGMKVWMDWANKAGDSIVDLGTPLGTGKELGNSGVTDAGANVGGYSIPQAEDMDSVLAILEGHPHFMMGPDATIQVFEALEIPGM